MKKFFLFAATLLLIIPSLADARGKKKVQTPYAIPGGTPLVDSLHYANIKAKLAEISKRRPTVALVLCGGGAKGASHVGAIRYLEELGIPVDVVLGTSFGGLVGGLYALGYNADDMEKVLRSIDWTSAMSDKIPRNYISYKEKKYREKFALSFPFYYSPRDMDSRSDSDDVKKRYDKIHLSAETGNANSLVKDNLLGSLPSGFVYGQNVSNLLSSLTVGFQDVEDFSTLPVPFVCVATDLVTGRAKIWAGGKLNTALRSTMSIPGVFAPVKVDGMVLVDGGMRDNYPTDIARDLGADIIIGVDLSEGSKPYEGINNLADILMQGVNMLGRESYEQNVPLANITIKPSLPEYNMMSFDPVSVDSIMTRGYRAALDQKDTLLAVKRLTEKLSLPEGKAKAVNMSGEKVLISGIDLEGVSEAEEKYLRGKIHINLNEKVGRDELESVVAAIYGTKSFDYVTYELLGEDEPYHLRLNCRKGPVHHFGIGARLDTEEIVALMVNFGLNVHRIKGAAVEFTGKVSTNPYANLHAYYTGRHSTINAEVKLHYVDRNKFDLVGHSKFNAGYLNLSEQIYLSNVHWSKFDLKVGGKCDFFKLNSIMADSPAIWDYDLAYKKSSNYVSAFLNARADTFNDGYFPTSGFTLGLDYSWTFTGFGVTDPFSALSFDTKFVIPVAKFMSLLPYVNMRMLFVGQGKNVPLPFANFVGGRIPGRYFDQQIAFAGTNNLFFMNNMVMMAGADLRFKLYKNNYLTASVNVADTFSKFSHIFRIGSAQKYIGTSLEYAYNTIVGPLRFDVHWSNLSKKVGVYLSLGFDF